MDCIAYVFPTSPFEPDVSPVVLAHAPDLATLAERVRAQFPEATVVLYNGPAALLVAGRPVHGLARGAGRPIYLCAPLEPGRFPGVLPEPPAVNAY